MKMHTRPLLPITLLVAIACGGDARIEDARHENNGESGGERTTARTVEPPPESGPARDIRFPPIERQTLANGLELNTVPYDALPVVYLRLVIKSGAETDPDGKPGVADLVAQMLQEGTRGVGSAELAEKIEFLGADLWTGADAENVELLFRALSTHLDEAMEILADVARNPAFRNDEYTKLMKREKDRLAMARRQPSYLARRAFFGELYGDHPYARVDTTEEALSKIRRSDLQRWHRAHFVPSNAILVAVGDVTPERLQAVAERAFGSWRGREVQSTSAPEPPARQGREVVIVDRPGSVQSTVYIGELAMARSDDAWVAMEVANQVIGGSASSRLFLDLRERRGLTYGAYSQVVERVQTGPFVAMGSVRTEVTGEAVAGFFEHLDQWVSTPPSADEVRHAEDYLSDSFPLSIDTPAKIASMVADLRVYNLPDDYWESYRTDIAAVTAAQALAVAQAHVHPDKMLVVVVGQAADIAEDLRRWGPVRVLDETGAVQQRLEPTSATPAASAPGAAPEAGALVRHEGLVAAGSAPNNAAPASNRAASASQSLNPSGASQPPTPAR